MEGNNFFVCGEVLKDEDAVRLISTMQVGNIIKPKMSLEELVVVSHEVYREINEFEDRWIDKVSTLSYKAAINLLFAEIDRYPTIRKYNENRREDLQTDLAEGLVEYLGYGSMVDWSFIKCRLINTLTPNRWV